MVRFTTAILVLTALLPGAGASVNPFQPDLDDPDRDGRAISVAADATNSQRLFVASETGGLFFTSDGGTHFTRVDSLPSFNVVDVAYAPDSGSVVIATASTDYHLANGPIWRSADGGATWTNPASSNPLTGPDCDHPSAYGLSFEPGGQNVYVGTDCGLAVSPDLGLTWSIDTTLTTKRVWSVLAQKGGRVNVAAEDGLWYRASSADPWKKAGPPAPAKSKGFVHALAASPYFPQHLFYVKRSQELYISNDGGAHWTLDSQNTVSNRPQFVRAVKAAKSGGDEVTVFWGDGQAVQWRTYKDATAGLTGAGAWTPITSSHPDPADLAFDAKGVPLLLVTDGGAHRYLKGEFVSTGGGPDGYNALQINEVMGQAVTGAGTHQDLYFDTQDNGIPASANGGADWTGSVCCEGSQLRAAPTIASDADAVITGRRCGNCSNFTAPAHFPSQTPPAWSNPGDGDSVTDDIDGTPVYISPGRYIQNTIDNDAATPVNTFKTTQDGGAHWNAGFTIEEPLRGPAVVAGSQSSPVVYQAVLRPGTTSDGEELIGLVKISGLFSSGGATLCDVDCNGTLPSCVGGKGGSPQCGLKGGNGFGSLGMFQTVPADYAVFGAQGADRLVFPDIEDDEVKQSFDGGATFAVDPGLTALITSAGGGSRFRIGQLPDIHAIAFDPEGSCHVLAGSAQNGIFRSTDGGSTWAAVADSERAGSISSFYFPPTGDIFVSSYGSGLWKLGVTP